jgi:hypothetical protein
MPISTTQSDGSIGDSGNTININDPSADAANVRNVIETDMFSKYGRAYPRGICVKSVHKKSPAFKAGLVKRDVILKIDDVFIDNVNTYYLLVAGAAPNSELNYHIIRETGANNSNRSSSRGNRRNRGGRERSQARDTYRNSHRGRGNDNNNNNNKNNDRENSDPQNSNRSRSLVGRDKRLFDIAWTEFESYQELDILVPIKLIPPPSKKPLEIKDRVNPFFGAEVVELCPAINSDFGLDFNQMGVAIWDLERGSQADKLNFRIGDIILYADNFRIRKLEDVESIGERMQMRKNCRIKYKRAGKINHVDVYLRSTRRRYYSRL